jgi:hypothetical protein
MKRNPRRIAMAATLLFGYALVALSAVLLALHWQHRRDLAGRRMPSREWDYVRGQFQRRAVASGMIGVVGAAMTLIERVPRTAASLSAYLFALVLGGVLILAIALADLRAARRHREGQQLELLKHELKKAMAAPGGGPASD